MGNHLKPHGSGFSGQKPADAPVADNPNGLPGKSSYRFQVLKRPFTRLNTPGGKNHFTGQAEYQRQGMIRHLFDAVIQHIADHDALLRGCRDVDIVHSDAIPDDDFTSFQSVDDRCGNRGPRNQNAVRVPGDFDNLGFCPA